jgi:hypothetical protein
MPAKEPHQKTIQVHGVRYVVHERSGFTPWRICIKKDGNEHAYTPTFRTGWEDGGEVEIFSLLADYTDTILFQLRIYTKASSNDNVPETPHPHDRGAVYHPRLRVHRTGAKAHPGPTHVYAHPVARAAHHPHHCRSHP